MSLTRNQWIEMWSDIKQIESNTSDLMIFIYPTAGPNRQKKIKEIVRSNRRITLHVKNQIQSIIGQLE
jgi:hypothetical protein